MKSALRRRCLLSRALVLFLMSLPAGFAAAQGTDPLQPQGPLPYRNREPLNAPFLLPQPTDGRVLGTGKERWDGRLEVVNDLFTQTGSENRRYETDFEEQRFYIGYARGIGGRQEVGIEVPWVARNGGFLDTFVNNWHRIFGFAGGGREDLPDYRTLYRVNAADGRSIINTDRGTSGFGDTVIEYRYGLTELPSGGAPSRNIAATARGLVKIPTGRSISLIGSGAVDFGAGIALAARADRRWYAYGNATLVLLGKPKNDALDAKRTQIHTLLGIEYLLDGQTSLVAQTDNNPTPFRSGLAYPDRPRRSFTFGAWRRLNENGRLFLGLSENDFGPLAKHAPDLALTLGVRLTK